MPTQKNSASWDLQLGFNLAFKRLNQLLFNAIMSFGKRRESRSAGVGQQGGCGIIIIFFLARNSFTSKAGALLWWRNQIPELHFCCHFYLAFPVDTVQCNLVLCNDADLQFDFVKQIHNAQLHDCPKKSSKHIRHM